MTAELVPAMALVVVVVQQPVAPAAAGGVGMWATRS